MEIHSKITWEAFILISCDISSTIELWRKQEIFNWNHTKEFSSTKSETQLSTCTP